MPTQRTTESESQIVSTIGNHYIDSKDPRVSEPVFTLSETAAYLGLPRTTVHSWARPQQRDPLFACFPRHGNQATVPFIGFAEAFVLSSFRRAGVPMQRIRPAVERLKEEIGIEHALASHSLFTDGAEVLITYADETGDEEVMNLVVVRNQQRQFSEVVKGYLQRIEYAGDGWAGSVRLPIYADTEVIVKPGVTFGLPRIAGSGARVEDLVDRFKAGDSVAIISSDFDVKPAAVEDVIRIATLT